MKILMLVNWKVEDTGRVPWEKQPPDYRVRGQKYWFFRYFAKDVQVDVADIRSFPFLEHLEKEKLRFYVWQTLRVLPKMGHYDLVLSHGMQSGILLCLFRRVFGKGHYKHVVFDIGAFNSAKESGGALKLMQHASRSLDGVIYHTSSQRAYYRKCHPWLEERARFIPFGTDTDFFCREGGAYGGEKTVPYILCIGYDKRDWDTLLRAFSMVDTDVRLRLVGNTDVACADERVEILPPVPVRRLQEQIRGSLFGVLPLRSFNYSFGQMTLLQQMAMGKAVIAADVPSLRDYVRDGETAICYPPEDADVLADKIRLLLDHPERRDAVAACGAESVRTQFCERLMAERIEAFLDEVMYEG